MQQDPIFPWQEWVAKVLDTPRYTLLDTRTKQAAATLAIRIVTTRRLGYPDYTGPTRFFVMKEYAQAINTVALTQKTQVMQGKVRAAVSELVRQLSYNVMRYFSVDYVGWAWNKLSAHTYNHLSRECKQAVVSLAVQIAQNTAWRSFPSLDDARKAALILNTEVILTVAQRQRTQVERDWFYRAVAEVLENYVLRLLSARELLPKLSLDTDL